LAGLARREGREVAGRGRIHAAAPDRLVNAVKKKKGRGGEGADRWGPVVSAAGKKKREGGSGGLARGVGLGRLGRKEPGWFCFFSFLFPNFFFKPFFNSNSIQTFSNFSQEFYRLFRNHTSNQKPCKPTDDAHTLVVSKFIKLSLIFLELNLNSNLISLNP
jgi:hypothetical protein